MHAAKSSLVDDNSGFIWDLHVPRKSASLIEMLLTWKGIRIERILRFTDLGPCTIWRENVYFVGVEIGLSVSENKT